MNVFYRGHSKMLCIILIFSTWFQFCDNDGACKLSESNISSRRMQHVASRLAYLQENVDELIIALFHFISKGNIADIGTKVLGPSDFHTVRAFLVR